MKNELLFKTKDELDEFYKKELKKLQKNCEHKTKKWFMECWAPGHFSDYKILICEICAKRISRKKCSARTFIASNKRKESKIQS